MSTRSPFKNSHDQMMVFPSGYRLKVQVKRFVHVPCMSEETECFTADLWLGGAHVAVLANNGHGEGSHARPREHGSEALRQFEELVETLPYITIPATEYSEAFTVKCAMEHWIDEVVGDMIEDAQAVKLCKKGLTYVKTLGDNTLYTLKKPYTLELALLVRRKYPEAVIYNEHLPKPKGRK